MGGDALAGIGPSHAARRAEVSPAPLDARTGAPALDYGSLRDADGTLPFVGHERVDAVSDPAAGGAGG